MAKGHFLSGVTAGLLSAPLAVQLAPVGTHTPAEYIARAAAFSGLVGFGALWPDIDHPPALISKIFGPVSWLLNHLMMWISRLVYEATRTEKDKPGRIHRTFTHTNLASLLVGGLLYAGLLATPVHAWAAFLAVGFTLGALAHIWFIGDACTVSGVPHPLAPLVVINGKRWSTVGFPRFMRFRAGGKRGTVIKGEIIATWAFMASAVLVGSLTLIAYGVPWWMPVITLLGGS
jgi:membrane-bound metal-dependent hydrolase YbcI (DUF457 family)